MAGNKDIVMARARSFITKIEGHGSLRADFRTGKVKLVVHEGERLFEGILVGRALEQMQWITPRICGVCPIAHNLASLAASEAALGMEVSRTTTLLRRLMRAGQNIQSHILHTVFLALPDYLGMDRITELAGRDPRMFRTAIGLKETGDEIARVVAGRSVHPTRTRVGGFHKVPTEEELKTLAERIRKALPGAKKLARLFAGLDYPALVADLELLALRDGQVASSRDEGFSVGDYKMAITEEVRDYSTARFGSRKGRPVMVGALARLFFRSLEGEEPLLKKIDYKNPFHNNLAQAVEVCLELEEALETIKTLLEEGIDGRVAEPSKNPPLRGIGAVEAPRGGLYNEVRIDRKGMIRYANIVTPTVQNLTSMEHAAEQLLGQNSRRSRAELSRLLEMLVRAFDPCITCSTH